MMVEAKYRRGEQLFGDDLDQAGIAQWFKEEEYGYYNLADAEHSDGEYGYHGLNYEHLFKFIKGRHFSHCLGIGCADGAEIKPIIRQVDRLTGLEPAEGYWRDEVAGVPAQFIKPDPSGRIALPDASVDLITCLGVLHHIPNVSTVLNELSRVARPGATFLLREPSNSMGDWTKPRSGLTKNERGIPEGWMVQAAERAGFKLRHKSRCISPFTPRVAKALGVPHYFNPRPMVLLDKALSASMGWNVRYERNSLIRKLAPLSAAYVFDKPAY